MNEIEVVFIKYSSIESEYIVIINDMEFNSVSIAVYHLKIPGV